MTFQEAMRALEKAGTAQNRKVYARHGVRGPQFGVSFANLKILTGKIKQDQALAERLWKSGNDDARILATMIADPARVTSPLLESWAKDLDNYGVAMLFASMVGRTPLARDKASRWCKAKGEWVGQAGWDLVCHLALRDAELPDSRFEDRLATIEREIHARPSRVRYSMNSALIAIGLRNERLKKLALGAAGRIGTVTVDHGETGCKTPDAAAYIEKAAGRWGRKKRAASR